MATESNDSSKNPSPKSGGHKRSRNSSNKQRAHKPRNGRHSKRGRYPKSRAGEKRTPRVRSLAGQILQQCMQQGLPARELLHKAIEQHKQLARRDAGFLTELVYGTLRSAKIADHVWAQLSNRRLDKIKPRVLHQLRLAFYQLFFLQTPAHAAVNETVDLFRDRGERGFVNALLRNLIRKTQGCSLRSEFEAVPISRRLPCNDLQDWVFTEDFFSESHEEWLSQSHGLPHSHVQQLIDSYGFETAQKICLAHNLVPNMHLRLNPKRVSVPDLLSRLSHLGFQAEAGMFQTSVIVRQSKGSIDRVPGFRSGEFVVQDQAAQHLAPFAKLQGHESVLDYCSAPGGKALHLATLATQGRIVATDIDSKRLQDVFEAKRRSQLDNLEVLEMSKLESLEPKPQFDCVVVDVPCSNTGVIRRRPELRHRLDQLDLPSLLSKQLEIVEHALKYLKPEGTLLYSTCSIDPRENQQQVAKILAKYPRFSEHSEQLLLPNDKHDGAYTALLQPRPE